MRGEGKGSSAGAAPLAAPPSPGDTGEIQGRYGEIQGRYRELAASCSAEPGGSVRPPLAALVGE